MKKNEHVNFLMSLISFLRDFKTRNVPDLADGGIVNNINMSDIMAKEDVYPSEIHLSDKHKLILENLQKDSNDEVSLQYKIHGVIKAHERPQREHEP